jgi:hypothetical protein
VLDALTRYTGGQGLQPQEAVEILGVGITTKRLECSEKFCRYYLSIRESQKPCEWAYMSIETLQLFQRYAGRAIDRRSVTRYTKRHGLLAPKMLWKVSWRI